MEYVLGAQLYTVREFCKTVPDIAATFKKVAGIGYKAVQVSGIGTADARDVALIANDNGLTISATHMPWPRFRNELADVIATHKAWNCSHSAIGSLPAEYYSVEGVARFLAELAPIAKTLAAEGIDFSFHNHQAEFIKLDGRLMMDRLLADSPADMLKFEIDTYWVQVGGQSPANWIRKVAGRIPLLHLKDYAIAMSDPRVRMSEIGQGNLDWQDILAAAKQAGVRWYLVEQDDCNGRDPFESLAISYRYLRGQGLQ